MKCCGKMRKGTRRVRKEQVVTPSSSSLLIFSFPSFVSLFIRLFSSSSSLSASLFSTLTTLHHSPSLHPPIVLHPSLHPPLPHCHFPPPTSLLIHLFSLVVFSTLPLHPVQTSLCVNGPDRTGPGLVFFSPRSRPELQLTVCHPAALFRLSTLSRSHKRKITSQCDDAAPYWSPRIQQPTACSAETRRGDKVTFQHTDWRICLTTFMKLIIIQDDVKMAF